MPELPEVEVTMRGIRPEMLHEKIKKIWYDDKKLREPFSKELHFLEGARIDEVGRRAKYIVVKTAHGSLIIHLGMTGHLSILKDAQERKKHDHFEVELEDGVIIRYNDARRFGLIAYLAPDQDPETSRYLKDLGPEPLSEAFNATYLHNALKKHQKAVKQSVMDAAVVVGVGNIYASEVLFLSKIDPRRKACSLTFAECERLVEAIKVTLAHSIEKGGTTIINFQGADGKLGYFVQDLKVYGHAGEPCKECGTVIESVLLGQRSTYFCPHCQH